MSPREDDLATQPAPPDPGAPSAPSTPSASSASEPPPSDSAAHSASDADDTLTTLAAGISTPGASLVRGHLLGRYVVLAELGAGAMGRVYQAFDPKLDRRIAIKVLRLDASRGARWERAERRLLREAQALAKLRHPNVVAVHDVESTPEGLAVTMDYIEGRTLRKWLAEHPRTWREVLAVMRGAAQGLAAAHRAGLVHRDFKPDNVMIDGHGTAHVVDFGLAQAFDSAASMSGEHSLEASRSSQAPIVESRTMAHAGTPAYMAPEQHRGQGVGPAADQFAYCVTLYEALWGKRPFPGRDLASLTHSVISGKHDAPPRSSDVPRFVREVVLRGLATDPEDRFETMDALLEALAHDPTARRHRIVAGVGVMAMGGLAAWGWIDARTQTPPCQAGAERVAEAWDEARRDAVTDALLATQVPYAASTAGSVATALDEYASTWASMLDEACAATKVEKQQSERMLDLRTACLEGRKQRLAAALEVLAHADAQVVENAGQVVAGLPPLEFCADLEALDQAVPPPEDAAVRETVEQLRGVIALAESLEQAGKFEDAEARLVEVEAQVDEAGYPPLKAEWLYTRGDVADSRGDAAEAERLMSQAAWTAQRAKHDTIVAAAMTELVYVVGNHLARADDGLLWAQHAEAAIDRIGNERLRARLQNHRGMTLDGAGRYEEALAALGLAKSAFEALEGPDSWNTLSARSGYASALESLGRFEESEAEYAEVLATTERLVGTDHPDYAAMLTNYGLRQIQGNRAEAGIENLERARVIFERVHGPLHPHLGAVWTNLAVAYYQSDDYEKTREALERALAINEATLGPDHPDVAKTVGNLGGITFQLDDLEAAEEYSKRSLDLLIESRGPEHPDVGDAWLQLSIVRREKGRLDEALTAIQRAETILRAKLPADHINVGRVLISSAQLHFRLEQFEDMARYASEALRIFETQPERMPWLRGQARFYVAAKRWSEGERNGVIEAVKLAKKEVADDDEWVVATIQAWLDEHAADR